jgi:hypothetical protein
MTRLDFVTDDEAGDVAFIKATRTIGGRDAIEEYMASGLFPLLVSFNLGEIAEEETLVSKLPVPLPEFPVARCSEEMNDGFWARMELAAVNVVGRYVRGEHKACVEMVPNRGRVNRVLEQANLPYEPHLEPVSEVLMQAPGLSGNTQRCLAGRR